MTTSADPSPSPPCENDRGPVLDPRTRLRLGLQLQALYASVLDDVLDSSLTELL